VPVGWIVKVIQNKEIKKNNAGKTGGIMEKNEVSGGSI